VLLKDFDSSASSLLQPLQVRLDLLSRVVNYKPGFIKPAALQGLSQGASTNNIALFGGSEVRPTNPGYQDSLH
jgi:hypothetical protein